MKRYIHMDENEDGTITMVIMLSDEIEEMTVLLPMDFNDLMAMFISTEAVLEAGAQIGMSAIVVPNDTTSM
jgi:hypothetical protein